MRPQLQGRVARWPALRAVRGDQQHVPGLHRQQFHGRHLPPAGERLGRLVGRERLQVRQPQPL